MSNSDSDTDTFTGLGCCPRTAAGRTTVSDKNASPGNAKDSEESEEDYMSAEFLNSMEEASKKTTHASSSASSITYSERRKRTLAEQQTKAYNMPVREQSRSLLEKGLQTHIPESNVGFKMLAKMGYQKGTPLGNSASGIVEPIQVTLKSGRHGVGVEDEASVKRKRTEMESVQIERQQDLARCAFRSKMNENFDIRRVESDLQKARASCMTMDERAGLPWHIYWPPQASNNSLNDDQDTPHLTDQEVYHRELADDDSDAEALDNKESPQSVFDSLELQEQLQQVIEYLRCQYYYCLWCGAVYADRDELSSQCPGNTFQDHEDE
ncbi:hypothetical protein BASA82_001207 [Batrachochytrium salamandrivorans]|uniref:G-patch domain-containing protein n=1 Tax=Batrachochytrium salamandrivorans TaxID=1357716 RepID=A0ABQ8F7P7_9FUNG|nr:hypothetical protein BASA62_005605 [Batrachochytrium salamandrivorans]KAH6591807.1 hypothetical protein BASA61_004798 [Batrachochytrium salamandrivorans]KAH6593386.1 hypothetical protein BASA50_007338 [Batrachochytrium salamandrivorans]KAH9256787.1 hypothetical protein BASA81_005081 [Batrachochytrium salamandrivorans]KAH9259892.1 hypothetical protein BASA82_001207 [Batrachochytrium salamandrivorans]